MDPMGIRMPGEPREPPEPAVKFWEDVYTQRYPGSTPRFEPLYSPIDHEYLYKALDKMPIKVCGDTTGVDGSEFLNSVERPSYKIPFHEMVTIYTIIKRLLIISYFMPQVDKFLNQVTQFALYLREENCDWDPKKVIGIGPSRSYYLLSNEVISGDTKDGFHHIEKPMTGRFSWTDDGGRFFEFPGFTCANRSFRVR